MWSCMAACEDKKMIEGKGFPERAKCRDLFSRHPLTVSEASIHWHVCLLKFRHGTFREILKQPLIWCHDGP